MKFEFSLKSVLKVRKHEEQLQKQKLAEKLSEKKDLKAKKENLQQKIEKHINENSNDDFMNLHDLQRKQQYINDLYEKVKRVNNSLATIRKAVDRQRNKLADVHKKRHIMEKIREEEREVFLEEVSKKERKVMDEVATQTFSN